MKEKHVRQVSVYFLVTHSAIALVAGFGDLLANRLSPWPRFTLLSAYVVLAYFFYLKLQAREKNTENAEIELWKTRSEEWKRYHELKSGVLNVIGEFFKDKYKEDFDTFKVATLQANADRSADLIKKIVAVADKDRRANITEILTQIVFVLKADSYSRPANPELAVQDIFKVTFYDVGNDERGAHLRPRYRYYPNEAEPRTKRFNLGEGAAGKAWRDKQIYVCENGGDDENFEEMYPDKTQRSLYASMICIPVIVNIPEDKISEVYGVLTVDSRVRRGYFRKDMRQFWGDLFQPVCNFLVYCEKSHQANGAVGDIISTITSDANAATA